MTTRFLYIWQKLRESYWFLPTVMTAVAVGLTQLTRMVDDRIEFDMIEGKWWIWSGGAEGARALLSTIAGSMITVAGVVFSVTIVALTLASQQYGPRLLRNFMRDRSNQVVLGTFISTFVYCLVVMRMVRGVEDSEFVPYVSVTGGMVLALASVGVLIHFIHHVSSSIQAQTLITRVFDELEATIARLYPEKLGTNPHDESEAKAQVPPNMERESRRIGAGRSGYLEAVEAETLLEQAADADLIVALKVRPGDFVVCGDTVALAWPSARCDDDHAREILGAFILGEGRTQPQDAGFPAIQLVEVALRALSPSLNDPFTAINCIDWLGAALGDLAERKIPSRYRLGEKGALRVIAEPSTLVQLADEVLHPLRRGARGHVSVTMRLFEAMHAVAVRASRPEDIASIREHADLLMADSREAISSRADIRAVEAKHRQVNAALNSR
jgi:uncharacterized membrane protein